MEDQTKNVRIQNQQTVFASSIVQKSFKPSNWAQLSPKEIKRLPPQAVSRYMAVGRLCEHVALTIAI